jgi:protein-S-isoprenylcysteine O-methyltransferase Ste14
LVVWKRSPDTLRERARFASQETTQSWDRILVLIVGLVGPAVTVVVAGLDERLGWSGAVPLAGQIMAALAVAGSCGLAGWAMVVNPFFSAVARLQGDRGQWVVTAGPYRYMRHPSYAGAVVAPVALPFMLDAVWALMPAAGMVAGVAVPTALEDGMLREGLDGYEGYAEQTPYRLIPGVW